MLQFTRPQATMRGSYAYAASRAGVSVLLAYARRLPRPQDGARSRKDSGVRKLRGNKSDSNGEDQERVRVWRGVICLCVHQVTLRVTGAKTGPPVAGNNY